MNIEKSYINSLLAQMSYANGLARGMKGDALKNQLFSELEAKDVTSEQATYFAKHFRVVEQYSVESTGFSATLFERLNDDGTPSDEYHLANRGSGNFFDPEALLTDWLDANVDNGIYGASLNQVIDLVNFYIRLTGSGDVAQFGDQGVRVIDPQ
jgi:hypothetical protein